MNTPHDAPIRYGLARAADVDEMAKLLGEVFATRDPPAVAAGLTPAEFEQFVRLFCPRAAGDGLTVVARSAGTGAMCGALLAEDSAAPFPDGIDRVSPKFEPIFDILGQLDAEHSGGRAVPAGQSVHLFLLGVASDAAGRGVAQQLVSQCMANASRRGYRVAVTEATNRISQHVFRKLGFVERVRRSYADHRFDGRATFSSIVDHGGPVLMDRPLGGNRPPARGGGGG